MRVAAFECAGEEFVFVVLEGSQTAPCVIVNETRKSPSNSDRPEKLQWLRKEVMAILDKYHPDCAAYKAAQSMPGRSAGQERCQFEGVMVEAAASHSKGFKLLGLITVQIKKRLGLSKSKGTSCLDDLLKEKLSELPKKHSGAALVALSMLQA